MVPNVFEPFWILAIRNAEKIYYISGVATIWLQGSAFPLHYNPQSSRTLITNIVECLDSVPLTMTSL